ncbi:MAG TPA: Asp-tRNA(Asn)/Glu-tRNA(Gln) amidotransferase subunit GatB, partial [Acidimicrobiales bacterium]
LPVLNRAAVELAMRIGAALHCEVKPSIFHRKNYFYPDMPKDYQISQYDKPINVAGWLELADGRRVGIERAHLEEDTGKTTHVGRGGRIHEATESLVDYNRAGVPLLEIVSAPDIRSADQARVYVGELRGILMAVGASDARMEEGSLRVDANVSVRPAGSAELGTRAEIKNMNSLRSLGRAIEHESERQVARREAGEPVVQETRHWNEAEGRTSSLRSKEEAYDYRYFPEPDLLPVAPDATWISKVRAAAATLPAERRAQLSSAAGADGKGDGEVPEGLVATLVELDLDGLVLGAIDAGADPRLAVNRAANEAAARPDAARELDPRAFAALLSMETSGQLSATQAKTVLGVMLEEGGDPADIARARGFEGLSEEALASVVDSVLAANPEEWQRFRDGDPKVSQFLVGQVMRETRGKANGKAVMALLAARKG